MASFPDDRSLAHLRSAGVTYVIVHKSEMPADEYDSLISRMAERADLAPVGTLRDPQDEAALFVVEP
jgi:hypothetical protein